MNVHLSYKPTSSCRILFQYGGYPRQFNLLKKFRAMVVPGGGCRKGIIIQGRQLLSGLPVIGHSCLRIKWDVTGLYVHAPRQSNSTYVQTFRRSIYKTRGTKHHHSTILRYQQRPLVPSSRTRYMESWPMIPCNRAVKWVPGGLIGTGRLVGEGVQAVWSSVYNV